MHLFDASLLPKSLQRYPRNAAGVPGVKPVIVELTDFKTKEKVDELEVDAVLVATGRAPYTQVLPHHEPYQYCNGT
jgi:hypothetical protein